MPAHGTLDRVTPESIDGWAFDPARPEAAIAVAIYDGETKIATLLADRYRKDLEEAGHGDGRHAFHLGFPKGFFGLPAHRIAVRIAETGRELRRSPVWLKQETAETGAQLGWVKALIDNSAAAAESAEGLEPLAQLLVNGLGALMQRAEHLNRLEAGRPVGETRSLVARAKLPDHLAGLASQMVARHPVRHLPASADPLLSIVIAAQGSYADLAQCLESVLPGPAGVPIEIIVVDISGRSDMLIAPLLLPAAMRVLRAEKQSLAGAYQLGRMAARAPVCLFLDSAVTPGAGSVPMLLATLEDAGGQAIAAPRLLGAEGRVLEAGRTLGPAATRGAVGYRASAAVLRHRLLRDTDEVPAEIFIAPKALLHGLKAFSEAALLGDWSISDLCLSARAQDVPVLMQGAADATIAADMPLTRSGPPAAQRLIAERWQRHLAQRERKPRRGKALVIDGRFPEPNQDAGSEAVFSHALSLKRLGFEVSFLASDPPRAEEGKQRAGFLGLLRHGVLPLAPLDAAAELAAHAGEFDLVYLHRPQIAAAVLAAVKAHHPAAMLLYCPADFAHLRLQREAALTGDAALAEAAQAARRMESGVLAAADAVIVHSSHEAALCRQEGLHPAPHLARWTIRMKPTPKPFAERRDIGLIGGFRHRPNCDAAIWFATAILPRLRESEPKLQFYLAGSHMPPEVTALGLLPGVKVLGYLADLSRLLNGLRLTVAPLRFGAGLKGKVLTSFAAGVPCVMTGIAAEGMDLPAALLPLIAAEERFDAAVLKAMADAASWQALREAGLTLISEQYTDQAVDGALGRLIENIRSEQSAPGKRIVRESQNEHG